MNHGKRKGEWWECSFSGERPAGLDQAAAPDTAAVRNALSDWLQVSPRWIAALQQADGIRLQGNRLLLRLFPEEDAFAMNADWTQPLSVLYEDNFCLVADKPAGMKVHPTEPDETGTLLQAAAAHLLSGGHPCRPRPVHRLDEGTTGPVLLAKCDYAQQRLDRAMRGKRIDRQYVAIASGRLERDSGTIDEPIGRDRHHRTRRRVSRTGDTAVTHYTVMERLSGATLVRLKLETGRTHQIRVHLSHLGHPLLGDPLYGGKEAALKRQALHGERLTFPHPWTGQPVEVRSPWPDDFASLLESLQNS